MLESENSVGWVGASLQPTIHPTHPMLAVKTNQLKLIVYDTKTPFGNAFLDALRQTLLYIVRLYQLHHLTIEP